MHIPRKPVAIKDVKPNAESMQYEADEVILTKKIPHQNITKIIGGYLGPEGMSIVMELGSDSLDCLVCKKEVLITPFKSVKFCYQIAGALNCRVTHNSMEPIHHRDLNPKKVLIVNGQAKLAEFRPSHIRQRIACCGFPAFLLQKSDNLDL
eukprot:TRINITY_DN4244_c1_g1_i1.p1 TRINITY_DN4244_c1_g1~~TRINITY_DN4244_c1_g1_i1.p1  ORF type:complete len:151 (+),score=19.32 TRINITY_DN4244_c1_g1_i1:263-715(+)